MPTAKTSTIDRRLAANLSHRQVKSLDRIDGTLRDIEQTFRSLTAKLAGSSPAEGTRKRSRDP